MPLKISLSCCKVVVRFNSYIFLKVERSCFYSSNACWGSLDTKWKLFELCVVAIMVVAIVYCGCGVF
jgi:hypothetical protein